MRRILVVVTAFSLALVGELGLCSDHLASASVAGDRLAQAAAQREQDVRSVQRVLASPVAAEAAKKLGVGVERIEAAVPTLNDRELRDLSARAALVRLDPAAGHYSDDEMVHDFLVVFLVVAIVAVLLNAA